MKAKYTSIKNKETPIMTVFLLCTHIPGMRKHEREMVRRLNLLLIKICDVVLTCSMSTQLLYYRALTESIISL